MSTAIPMNVPIDQWMSTSAIVLVLVLALVIPFSDMAIGKMFDHILTVVLLL